MTGNEEEKLEEQQKREQQEHIDSEMENSKPSEEASRKTHTEILAQQILDGQETHDKEPLSVFLSSLTAGLEIGFSFLLICTLHYFLLLLMTLTIFVLLASLGIFLSLISYV